MVPHCFRGFPKGAPNGSLKASKGSKWSHKVPKGLPRVPKAPNGVPKCSQGSCFNDGNSLPYWLGSCAGVIYLGRNACNFVPGVSKTRDGFPVILLIVSDVGDRMFSVFRIFRNQV